MGKTTHPATVLVALNKSIVSRTKKLSGIFRACADAASVELKIMDEGRDLTPATVEREVANGIRAFIVGATGVSAAIDRIGRLKLPLATISLPCRNGRNVCRVQTDNAAIAREAARMFLSARTFKAYAYYPALGDPEWSRERENQFARTIGSRRHRAVLTLPHGRTATALKALPRPVGILAANDTYAKELLDICRRNGLRVPQDVSVVGVDNETFLCETTSPSLTSIEPDFEREGYEAARAVLQMLAGKSVPPRIECGIRRVVIRKSTVDERYAETLVNRALECINERATEGLTVGDLCAQLRVSRRLLSLRFREIRKSSPLDSIVERKLAALRKELADSDQPIALVCQRCGFGSVNHPKKLFRQRFKMTMREFRERAKGGIGTG